MITSQKHSNLLFSYWKMEPFIMDSAFGKIGTTSGEICFNTGMTGYQEVFTDPSYYGQIVIMNNVHIGNYGVKERILNRTV